MAIEYDLTIKEINEKSKLDITKYVKECEELYQNQIVELVKHLQSNSSIKFILVAGPSSAGKTTTARLLCENFKKYGILAKPISLDDFFVNRDETPKWPNGKYNYESVDSIDWKLFETCVNNLLKNGKSQMPTFNFVEGVKSMDNILTLQDNEVIIIEGLHALNTIIDNYIPSNAKVRVYISPRVFFFDESGKVVMNGKEMRFFRRLIRDAYTRGASPERTLELWPDVLNGETLYIKPFKNLADFHINSCHPYEVGIYKKILRELNLLDAEILKPYTKQLELFEEVDKTVVPETSLLTEFVH